jgi:uncharacterized protein YgfB (UPF0149 family)
MDLIINHEELETALRDCGSSWSAAQSHGLLCSRLALAGAEGVSRWQAQVLADVESESPHRSACDSQLESLCKNTWGQLTERQSAFTLLLPDDEDPITVRAQALGQWCEGFLHGLVSETHGDELKGRLAADPLVDIIKDMVEITRATAGDDADDPSSDEAWSELVEYLRVAAQLVYEELAEFRDPAELDNNADQATVH